MVGQFHKKHSSFMKKGLYTGLLVRLAMNQINYYNFSETISTGRLNKLCTNRNRVEI